MTGRAHHIRIAAAVVAAAMAVAASGIAANDAFAEPEIDLVPRDSVADSDFTYLQGANQVEVFVQGNKRYAVVASTDESIHLLDITDPANINELRHPNRQQQSGNNNFNNAIGGETATTYVANDGNLYIVLSWSTSDAIQTFHIHENGRLDELAHVVDSSKMDLATDLFVYSVGGKHYAAVAASLSNSLRIVDVTDPRSLGTAALRGQITDNDDILLQGPSGVAHYQKDDRHYAVVVTDSEDSVQIIDVTNPNSPTAAGSLRDNGDLELNGAEDVAIYAVGDRTYAVVTGNTDDGIQIVDITNPNSIFPAGQLEDDHSLLLDNPRGVAVHAIGDRHYAVVASSGDHGILVVDITNPHNPVPKASLGDGQRGADELYTATGVDTFSIGNRHYAIVAANNDNGVQMVEMTEVTADARESQAVRAGQAVVLDGSASAVSSGMPPTYQWTQTAGPTVTLQDTNAARLNFTAPSGPSTLVFQLAVTHGGTTSTDVVTVSVAPDAATPVDNTAVGLTPRDSVADSDFTYLQGANQVEVFVQGNKRYAVVASTDESIHLLDITDPANINELRHPNRQQQSGNNNFNNAIGGETATTYVANDGNLYIVLSWSTSDAIQTFHIHENGRLDELAHVVDSSKMDLATDLFVYSVGGKHYAAVAASLSNSLRIVDVTDPRSLGTAALRGQITDNDDILLQGPSGVAHYQKDDRHYAVVVTDSEDSVQIIDVTNPNSPTAAGSLRDNGDLELNGAEDVAIYAVGDRTYAVVTGNTDDGIQIVDITDPHDIFPAGQLEDTLASDIRLDNPRGVAVHAIGDRHYAVVASSGDHGILVVDITNPHNPVPKASLGDGQRGADELYTATGVDTFSIGNRHYAIVAANNDNGVQMVEMTEVTADARESQAVRAGQAVVLDGSASAVSSGMPPTYQWTQTAGSTVTLQDANTARLNFTAPSGPSTLVFQLAVTHGGATSTDVVTVSVAPDAATSTGETAVGLTPRDSVADSDFTYLQGANQVEVFVQGNKRYAVVASTDESIHLLDITDPANINELRHPNRQQQSGNNNFNNAIGGETATTYVANDGNLYIVLSWSTSDAIQTFHIHENGRLDELAHVVDSSKMDLATDLFVYSVGGKHYAAVAASLSNSLRIVDVTDPRSLGTAALRGQITDNDDILLQGPSGVAHYQKDDRHYAVVVTDSEDSVQIIDVTNPNSPFPAGSLRDNGDLELNGAEDVAIYAVGDRTYAVVTGNTDDGIQIVDITDPHDIFPAGQLEDTLASDIRLDNPRGVAVHAIGDRHYAVVASSGDHGILVVDITNPHNPVPKASLGDGQRGADELYTATGVDTFSIGNRHYAIVAANNDNGVQMVEMTEVTADAGGDRAVRAGQAVILDGSTSTASSGATPAYQWTQTAGSTVTLQDANTARLFFTAPNSPLTLVFQLAVTHGGATSTDVVTVSVAPDAATSTGETAVGLTPRDSVADSDFTYLQGANQVEVFVQGNKRYAVVASTDESIHLLDITDPANINELRHPNRQQQSGNNNFNNAIGGETATTYVANDGNLYIVLSWSTSDAIQTFHIHENGRLDELASVVDSSKMDLATDLFVYSVGGKHYAAVAASLSNSLRIVDVTDPRSLGTAALRGQITDNDDILLQGPSGVAHYQKDDRHYAVVVTDSEDSVQIIDVTNPNSPTAAGSLRDNGDLELNGAEDVAIYAVGDRTYAVVTGNTDDGIQIVDITNPNSIFPAGQLEDDHSLLLDNPRGVAVHAIGDRHYAVVASSGDHGILVVDITNPHNPVPKASLGDGQRGADELYTATGVDTFSIGNRHYAIVAANNDNGVQMVEMTTVTADARESHTVRINQAVVLDGSASAVSSGATPAYQWNQTAGPTVTLQDTNAARLFFTAPSGPSTLVFQLAVTHGGATSTDIVTVSVAPDAATPVDNTAVELTPRDSVADSDFTYLQGANQVEVFVQGNKRYAVVASTDESIHLLDITDPANINELRHPNRQQQSGNNNFNNAIGGETATTYVANDGNLYIVLSWSTSDAIQTFHIHENGRLDELAHVVDSSKMDLATDLFVYTVQEGTCKTHTGCKVSPGDSGLVVNRGDPIYKQYAAVAASLSNSLRIVDVTDPRSLGTAALRGQITDNDDILLQGPSGVAHYQKDDRHYAVVVTDSEDSVQIIDVTNPNSPTAAGSLRDNGDLELNGAEDVAIYAVGDRSYAVVTGNTDDGIQIVDITNPNSIFPAGQLEDDHSLLLDNPRGVAVHAIGDRHYAVVASSGDHGILVVDITNPHNPVPKASLGDGQRGAGELYTATGVDTFSIGNRHYAIVAANNDNGVQMVEMEVLTADAGGDRAVPGRIDKVALDGSGSTVSSGATPAYQWTQTAGPPVTLNSATIANPNFVPPTAPQTLSFLLTVSHGMNASAVDTVTITLEGDPSADIESFGGQIAGDVTVGTVNDPVGSSNSTSQYISMHFAGEGESKSFTYHLLEATSSTVTVEFMMAMGPEGSGIPGYAWDLQAVSVSPQTLTFNGTNWYTPKAVTVTPQTDGDDTSEQVIIVIVSSVPDSYSGIHVTVDDSASPVGNVAGASGGPFAFESPGLPVITLSGPTIMDVPLNSAWTDPGYTATDADGNDITASVTVTGAVDTSQEGTYLLYYQVADAYGTPATPQIRTVNVAAPPPQYQAPPPGPEPEQQPQQEQPQQGYEPEPEPEPAEQPQQGYEPEPEPEPAEQPQQGYEPEPRTPVERYDSNGDGAIQQGEWSIAMSDYVDGELTTKEIKEIAAARCYCH